MTTRRSLILVLALWTTGVRGSDAWPEFRGPSGDGRSTVRELPLRWSETENVVWRTPIHGRGWSTPVVRAGQIWLTTATDDGRRLSALCVDLEDGTILHDRRLFEVAEPQPLGNPVNSYASPSPAIEQGRVLVHFGSYGTACLDTATGETVWERTDLPCNHFRGPGSSPILFEDTVILTMDGFDVQYLVALDKRTGRTVWKTDRSYDFGDLDGDLRKAYSTPLIVELDGVPQMLSCGAKAAYSYDPRTGRELWRVLYRGFSNASRPVFGQGLAFLNTGFGKADLWAVRPDGRGDVTDSHVVWRCTQGVPLKPSPVLHGDRLYLISDTGIASCLAADDGRVVWKQRLGGDYSASPLLAAGRVYVFSEEGTATVFRVGDVYEELARNELPDGFMASPAVSGRSLILRTKAALYRIEERG